MRWPAMVALSALIVGLGGCDKIPFLSKKKAAQPDTTAKVAAAPHPADTSRPAPPRPPPPTPKPTPKPAPKPADEPWTPVDTGTVAPGMTRDQVVGIWGTPVAERTTDDRTYLYYRNGCEVSCGTFDVVLLEKGQVVDAILRGPGHNYSGTSSSPHGGPPHRTGSQPLTLSSAAPSTAPSPAPSSARIAEFETRYQTSVATPEGKGYEAPATAAFWGDSAFMRTCAPAGGPVAQPFTLYFEVLQTGDLGELVFSPETEVAKCIRKEVAGRKFPPPPGGYFVGRIDMKFQP